LEIAMKIDGSCHCGEISYEAEIDPSMVGICHCTDCQKLTGSAFRANVSAPAETFVLRGIAPSIYIKTADSGAKRAHAFCPKCGTPMYATSPTNPTAYSLRLGSIAQRAQLKPRAILVRLYAPVGDGFGCDQAERATMISAGALSPPPNQRTMPHG
jgi:hypothetical protein